MQTSALIARVKNVFGDSNNVLLSDAMILDWINEASLEIAREVRYKITRDPSNTASDFIAGVDFGDALLINKVFYGSEPLALIDNETPDRMGTSVFEPQVPRAYYLEGTKLYLWPVPANTDSTTITVVYAAAPTVLTDPGTAIDCPTKFHNDIANYVLSKANERNENWRAAEYYLLKWEKGFGQRKYEGLSQDDSSYQIGPDAMDYDDFYGLSLS